MAETKTMEVTIADVPTVRFVAAPVVNTNRSSSQRLRNAAVQATPASGRKPTPARATPSAKANQANTCCWAVAHPSWDAGAGEQDGWASYERRAR